MVYIMSEKKLHYGVRLRTDQLKYLKSVSKPSEWIRNAVDEKRKREEKNRRLHTERWTKDLKMELILGDRLKKEMSKIEQRINKEKDLTKKAKMIKAYSKMSETLII